MTSARLDRSVPAMGDYQNACKAAIDLMNEPPSVSSKVEALDGLDRLALNPNGWFPGGTVNAINQARLSILVDRWHEAMVTLEGAFASIEAFIDALKARADKTPSDESQNAVKRAQDELTQCSQVQSYVVSRTV